MMNEMIRTRIALLAASLAAGATSCATQTAGGTLAKRSSHCLKLATFEPGASPKKAYDTLSVVRSEVAPNSASAIDSLRDAACDLHADAVINVVVEKVEGDQASASGVAVSYRAR